MAATHIATAAQNAACDAIVDLLDAGTGAGSLEIRSGTQPADANTAASGVALATFALPDPAFGAASSGTATANSITDVTGDDDGTATWFRAYDGDGTGVWDGDVSATGAGGNLQLNTTTISTGVDVSITSWTVTMTDGT